MKIVLASQSGSDIFGHGQSANPARTIREAVRLGLSEHMITMDPRQLAAVANAENAETDLKAMGCTLSPAHEGLWLVPFGKMRSAKQISRKHRYPAAFSELASR